MLLAIDVGNTNTKIAIFDGKEIKVTFRVTTKASQTSDEYVIMLASHLDNNGFSKEDIDGVVIASVVPDVMHSLKNCVIKMFGVEPVVVGPGTKTGIKLIKTNPNEVGSDRMAGGVAALEMYGGPVIVIDYGTATTIDYFSADSKFESAITCPGLLLSARALWEGTAKLPEIEIKNPGTILAKDTVTSLQAGILYGHIGEVEYIVDKIKEESTEEGFKVVATGGIANVIAKETDRIDYLEPNLLMHGLRIIYEKNK